MIDRIQKEGLLSREDCRRAQQLMAAGASLNEALTSAGMTEEILLPFLAQELGLVYIQLDQVNISKDFLVRFPARILLDKHILPVQSNNGHILVVTNNPFDTSGMDELRLATGLDLDLALAPLSHINRCIKQYLGVGADTVQSMISRAGEQLFG